MQVSCSIYAQHCADACCRLGMSSCQGKLRTQQLGNADVLPLWAVKSTREHTTLFNLVKGCCMCSIPCSKQKAVPELQRGSQRQGKWVPTCSAHADALSSPSSRFPQTSPLLSELPELFFDSSSCCSRSISSSFCLSICSSCVVLPCSSDLYEHFLT